MRDLVAEALAEHRTCVHLLGETCLCLACWKKLLVESDAAYLAEFNPPPPSTRSIEP